MSALLVKDLKSLLKARNLRVPGSKADLLANVNEPVLATLSAKFSIEGEFNWVVPWPTRRNYLSYIS